MIFITKENKENDYMGFKLGVNKILSIIIIILIMILLIIYGHIKNKDPHFLL
jgi:hypothetical protein